MTDNRTAMELHVLRRENAELRKLAADMAFCRRVRGSCDQCPLRPCRLGERMRKLGVTEPRRGL